jgi:hypothetical protein
LPSVLILPQVRLRTALECKVSAYRNACILVQMLFCIAVR